MPSLARFGAAAVLAALCAGCGADSEGPRSVVQEEPESVSNRSWVQGRGIGKPPNDMSKAQARLAAERAAKLAAIQDASAKAVEAGGTTVVAHFEILSTTWLENGTVEVIIKSPVQRP